MTAVIHVAAGVIKDAKGQILIARRPDHAHQGGLWEFPGGKLENGESAPQALARELQEELGIDVEHCEPLIQIRHDYPDKSVLLDVWVVDLFRREPHGREGQPVRWVAPADLHNYQFPAANVPIVTAAQLPKVLAITAPADSVGQLLDNMHSAIDRGAALIQLRQPQWNAEQWTEGLAAAIDLCRERGARLMLNNPPLPVIAELETITDGVAAGIHLPASCVSMAATLRAQWSDGWLSASCHSPEELRLAEEQGVDFVTLSPVRQTGSHPQAQPLGWETFAQWVRDAKVPVYALGGMTGEDIDVAVKAGAQGIAGIGQWLGGR